jgi:hypothetical protein
MPRDATTGVFTSVPGPLAPAVSGSGPVKATDWNTWLADVELALSRSPTVSEATVRLEDTGVLIGEIIATLGYLKFFNRNAEDEARIDFSPEPEGGDNPARVRVFRDTNTSGIRAFEVLRGDGTTTLDHQLRAGANVDSSLLRAGGKLVIGGVDPLVSLDLRGTDAMQLPSGTTAQRASAATAGRLRYNTTLSAVEISIGGAYRVVDTVTVTANGVVTAGFGQNTVIVHSSGLIEQFGRFGTGPSPLTGTFPLEFPTACRSLTLTAEAYLGSQPVVCNLGSQPTTTGFTVYRTGIGGQDREVAVHWHALGN